jgi:hypothetical protein
MEVALNEQANIYFSMEKEMKNNLYSSPSIIRVIKSRRIMGGACSTKGGRRGMLIGYWWESQKERDH